MRFVDEVEVNIEAGNGGSGAISFRREKYIPLGGPDGGDGGDGGSIYFLATDNVNTLVDFRYNTTRRADHGKKGSPKDCTGRQGNDLILLAPPGTIIYDADTEEEIGELTKVGEKLLVAKGGFHGLGNTRFKSSVNRAPQKATKGTFGEHRRLLLELKLIADVGLLGMPNAGKSSLIRSVSSAKPKVADYPFTTLHPNLGVVQVDDLRSFVIADIPGVIEGAAEGAGLGLEFLKHLSRTGLLLHIVDVMPYESEDTPAQAAKKISLEIEKWGEELSGKPRWLVLNKLDRLQKDESEAHCQAIIDELKWTGIIHKISALKSAGTKQLMFDIMEFLDQQKLEASEQD